MSRFLAVVMLGGAAIAQSSFANAKSGQNAGAQSVSTSETAAGILPALPPIPPGENTVIGGAIRDVDPVRDQFILKAFGGRPMKILFDERTRVYRDGVRSPLRDLRPEDHASVETVLDGTSVFAISIHVLSRPPEGECQGQVLNYNPGAGKLTVDSALSHHPIELSVPAGTPVVRLGQAATSSANPGSSDLVKGALISVKFQSDNDGGGVARQIAILATPGSSFVYSGNVTYLDLHSKLLVLVDPRDGKSYSISFDPARFPLSRDLHEGANVAVTANFDGAHYVASAIRVNSAAQSGADAY